MKLQLQRFAHGRTSTLGRIVLDGEHQCFTLEDEHRDVKVPGETRIPEGLYKLRLRTWGGFHTRYSARFGAMHVGMLELRNVPGFTDILIHIGNTEKDTAGCVLVGLGVEPRGTEYAITNSTAAYTALYKRIVAEMSAGEDVWLEVTSI